MDARTQQVLIVAALVVLVVVLIVALVRVARDRATLRGVNTGLRARLEASQMRVARMEFDGRQAEISLTTERTRAATWRQRAITEKVAKQRAEAYGREVLRSLEIALDYYGQAVAALDMEQAVSRGMEIIAETHADREIAALAVAQTIRKQA